MFHMSLFRPSGHYDYFSTSRLVDVISCVRHCSGTPNVQHSDTVLQNEMKHLRITDAKVVHDPEEKRVAWNQNRWNS